MSVSFQFSQIRLSPNENVTSPVLNRALSRLYVMIYNLANSDRTVPESTATELTYLANVYNSANSTSLHTVEWHTTNEVYNNLPKPPLTGLSDVTATAPTNGQVPTYSTVLNNFEFKKLPQKITDLENFENVDSSPVDESVITWDAQLGYWVSKTRTSYIGVGYIYHRVCSRPTVITLPESGSDALSGGEQIVITKLRPQDLADEVRLPVLITCPDDDTSIVGFKSILTNFDAESYASIHLRAVIDPDTLKYVWIPVCATGTWKPTNKTELTDSEVSGQDIDIPAALTENEIKLQPYNLSIDLTVDGSVVSQTYDIVYERDDADSDWSLGSSTSDYVYYSSNSGITTINHNILEGVKPVKTTVFFNTSGKLRQIVPNDVYFDLGASSGYSAVNIDLSDWLDDNSDTTLKFKVMISA